MFDTRHKIAKEIEKEFGIDVHSERLASVVDNMRENYKRIKSEQDEKLKTENERRKKLNDIIDKLNQEIDKENKKNKRNKNYRPQQKYQRVGEVTLKSLTEDLDKLLDPIEEHDKAIKSIFINDAVRRLYEPYRTAYFTGEANPYMVKT
nr:MAG TPA_asm: hypothetical protein [Bacteriophage sp.]